MTALGTAAGQNLTAILGGHAGTETMDTFALQNAGLKSTFHDKANAERSKTRDSIGIAPWLSMRFDLTPRAGAVDCTSRLWASCH
jgi:hypothetical protein